MAKFKAGSAATATATAERPQPQSNQEDPFDAWAGIIDGDSGREDITLPIDNSGVENPQLLASADVTPAAPVTITELPPVAIEPLPEVQSAPCEVVEVTREAVEPEAATDEPAVPTTTVAFDATLEPPEVAAAKLAYLRACLRLSAVEVKLDNIKGEIEEAETALELLKERQEELEERREPQHDETLQLYEQLAALLPPEELAAYEEDIERGTVTIPAETTSEVWESGHISESSQSEAECAAQVTTDNSAWRSRPTSELDFAKVRGMGQKKIAVIMEVCPTIGDLEDLRAGRRLGDGLTDIPGVGRKLADELENLILDWLTKNRDWGLLKEPEEIGVEDHDANIPGSAAVAGEQPTPSPTEGDRQEDVEVDEDVDAVPADASSMGGSSTCESPSGAPAEPPAAAESTTEPPAMPAKTKKELLQNAEAAEIAAVRVRFAELQSAFDGGNPPPVNPALESYVARGRQDFTDGYPATDCIYTAGDKQDHWLIGWLQAARNIAEGVA